MNRYLIPLLLVLMSGVMYVKYIDPAYTTIKENTAQIGVYEKALTSVEEVLKLQEEKQSDYKEFSESSRARLDTMLPPKIDDVRLIYDVNIVATRHNLSLGGVVVSDLNKDSQPQANDNLVPKLRTKSIKFNVKTSYPVFQEFVRDIELSLALRDINTISFSGGADAKLGNGAVFDYALELQTYSFK